MSADLQQLVRQIEGLSPDELRQLQKFICDRAPQASDTPVPALSSLRWVQPKLPLWLRVFEAVRAVVGAPKSLTALNYEQRANEAYLQEQAAQNTSRLTGRRHI